jgi:hypothetical protein
MDLREIGLGGVDWIRLSQDRDRWRAVVSAVMNLRVLAPWTCTRPNHIHKNKDGSRLSITNVWYQPGETKVKQ